MTLIFHKRDNKKIISDAVVICQLSCFLFKQ